MNDDFNSLPSMPGDWLFKVVPIFIAIVFVLVIGWYCFVGFVGYKAVNAAKDCDHPSFVVHTDKDTGDKSYSMSCEKKTK